MVALSSLGGAGWQFFDNNGVPLAGGKLYTYAAGTTTPQATYTSISGATPHTNPIILDSAGRVSSEIWVTSTAFYKFRLDTANDVTVWTKDDVPGILAANTIFNATDIIYSQGSPGAATRTVASRLQDFVSVKDFGAVGDGMADDTVAFQNALDSGQPVYAPPGEYLISDTLRLNPGAALIGAGGVANYSYALTKIKFEPASKRDVFNWKVTPSAYVFSGVELQGFTVRGFGAGVNACLDLPLLYNGKINFFAYTGVDTWLRVKTWVDCEARGGCQGFNTTGVIFQKSGLVSSAADITTTTLIDAYISQGGTAYYAFNNSVFECQINGVIESVDCAINQECGNYIYANIYVEKAPKTDTGAAFIVGKVGTSTAFVTGLWLHLQNAVGINGAVNTRLLDIDKARTVKVSGFAFAFGAVVATTANTSRVIFENFDVTNTPYLYLPGQMYDISKVTALGFTPRFMELTSGGPYTEFNLASPDLELFPVAGATRRKMVVDSSYDYKLRWRDAYGNYTNPIGFLQTSATSGWTFNGAALAPGEIVGNTNSTVGAVALWRSQLHSKDAATTIAGGTTTSGSPTVTNSVGAYAGFEVNDWVTASAGYPTTFTQYRIIAKATDDSSVTLSSNASSSVAGTVTLATAAHSLEPLAQQGNRTGVASPAGSVTPYFVGEEFFDTVAKNWYKSTGTTSADWKVIT